MYSTKTPITKAKLKNAKKIQVRIETNLDEKLKKLLSVKLGEELFQLYNRDFPYIT